jgi:hypothetical protein
MLSSPPLQRTNIEDVDDGGRCSLEELCGGSLLCRQAVRAGRRHLEPHPCSIADAAPSIRAPKYKQKYFTVTNACSNRFVSMRHWSSLFSAFLGAPESMVTLSSCVDGVRGLVRVAAPPCRLSSASVCSAWARAGRELLCTGTSSSSSDSDRAPSQESAVCCHSHGPVDA